MKFIHKIIILLMFVLIITSLKTFNIYEGAAGDKGAKGDKGDRGDKGYRGDTGNKGATGNKGVTGDKGAGGGSKGDKGDKGNSIKGDKGVKGDKGTSVKGDKGDKGDRGSNGTNGTNGKNGDRGYDGTPGKNGTAGERGFKGDQGLKGDKGEKGENGTNGVKGSKGDKGEDGPIGLQGPIGLIGPQGIIGPPGPQSKLKGVLVNNTIDRIYDKNGGPNGTGTYKYCLGGKVQCKASTKVDVNDNYKGGKTYEHLCKDKLTEPICANNYFSQLIGQENDTFYYSIGGIQNQFSTKTGFSIPYDTVDTPYIYDYSLNMIEFHHKGMYIDNVDICKFLGSQDRREYCHK